MTLDEAIQQGDYAEAVALLEELKAGPDPGKLFMRAEMKAFLEDFDGALSDLEELDRQEPGRGTLAQFGPVFTNAREWCHRQTVAGTPAKRASLAETPAWARGYCLALMCHARGDFAQANQELEQAQRLLTPTPGELTFVGGRTMAFTDLRDADALTG